MPFILPSSRLAAAACLAAASLAFLPMAAVAQPAPAPVTSTARGVTVKITPERLAGDADVWTFAVVLDTHSQDLADDLVNTVVLVTSDGREVKPTAWTGQPAGGHHREGKLQFPAPKPAPKAIELRMRRVGETEPRSFRWQL